MRRDAKLRRKKGLPFFLRFLPQGMRRGRYIIHQAMYHREDDGGLVACCWIGIDGIDGPKGVGSRWHFVHSLALAHRLLLDHRASVLRIE